MLKKYKNSLFSCLIIIFLFTAVDLCFSAAKELEVELPGLGKNIPFLPNYIKYIFNFVIMLAGAIAVFGFLIGAIRYMTSAGNPEAIGDAKKRMFSAMFGLVILLSSFLIIRTINPKLEELELSPIKSFPGIYFTDTKDSATMIRKPAYDIADTSKLDSNFKYIYYDCKEDDTPILIYIYPNENFGIDKKSLVPANTLKISCNSPFQQLYPYIKSFKIRHQSPGVYLYYGDGCSPIGFRTEPITGGLGSLPEPFNKHVGCVEIINDPKNNVYFGAMLHETASWSGQCLSNIIFSNKESRIVEETLSFKSKAGSVTVFTWQPDPKRGDFVKFYSKPFSDRSKGGVFEVINSEIRRKSGGYYDIHPVNIKFKYDPGVIKEEREKCPNFLECYQGSMEISGTIKEGDELTGGDYLVFIFGQIGTNIYCKDLWTTVENLKTWEFITRGGYDLYKVLIIPRQ